jgi:pyridoxamine 5'-phosphate oxidase
MSISRDVANFSILPPWRSVLAGVLHRNRSLPASRYLQLAMVDQRGRPTNRTVVFRGWRDPASQLQFVTDGRSALRAAAGTSKAIEIAQNPWAEACWYFAKTREQFRIAGTLELIDAQTEHCQPERQAAWEKMSAAGRAQFYWQLPGAARTEQGDVTVESTPAPDFCLLLLNPVMVDRLELRGNPQARSRYCLLDDQQWSSESINP